MIHQYPGSASPDVTYAYNNDGAMTGMSIDGQTVLSNAGYLPSGQLWFYQLGNSPVNFNYDYRQRMTRKLTAGVQDLTYTFDDAGNVKQVKDAIFNETLDYGYDDLDRLTEMKQGAATLADYSYDQIGNLITKSEGANAYRLCYPTSGPGVIRPHAASSVFNTLSSTCGSGTPWQTLSYDATGNLDIVGANDYTFDAENRLKTRPLAPGGTETYTYDAGGTMVKAASATTTVYVGGIYEKKSNGDITKYYQALGQTIALKKQPASGTAQTFFLHTDHLGSTSLITTTDMRIVERRTYWPFGGTRAASVQGAARTDLLYTGQREEKDDAAGLGLYNYKARFYSTVLGRFVSVDPLGGRATDPATLNGYAYTRNNPLRWIDPTGKCSPGMDCPADRAGLRALKRAYDSLPTQAAKDAFTRAFKGGRPALNLSEHAFSDRGGDTIRLLKNPKTLSDLVDISSKPENLRLIDKNGMRQYSRINADGSETWTRVGPDGKISNAGKNKYPNRYVPTPGQPRSHRIVPGSPPDRGGDDGDDGDGGLKIGPITLPEIDLPDTGDGTCSEHFVCK